MSRRFLAFTTATVVIGVLTLWLAPEALAAGNDVGRNLGSTLRHYAGQIYGGIVAIVGLVFLLNRRYTDLALFFLAAVLVGWLVFSPNQIAEAARGIGDRILP